MTLQWHHPLLDGGTDQTIHDAGKELFKHLEDLVREMCQNTNDAWQGGPAARIRFSRETHRVGDLPGFTDVLRRVRLCRKSQRECKASSTFLELAEKLLTANRIDSLRIGDRNTTGVEGDDKTKSSPWYRLVRSTGGTSKGKKGEGGSHGLGKIAAIAASRCNTVYYSTLAEDGGHRFIGTSLLASYEDEKGIGRQNRSFYGLERGLTVHDPLLIPPLLLRKEQGLDALIPLFEFKEDWVDLIAAAVLKFMWPAIHRGRFEAEISDGRSTTLIGRDNLTQMLHRHRERTNASLYHEAYTNPAFTRQLESPTIGSHSVHVMPGADLNNRFALFRRNGMVVEERLFRSRVRVCGAFECSDERGNEILRGMEPPRHDVWSPRESDDPKTARAADREVEESIKDSIRRATIPEGGTEGSVNGLENLLPMDGPIGGPQGPGGKSRSKPKRAKPPALNSRIPVTTRNRKKTPVRIGRLVARATSTSGGNYSLSVDHPSGITARIGIGIAGDSGTPNLARFVSASDEDGGKIKITKNRLSFGPVRLLKGTTRFQVRLEDERRIGFEVYSIEPPTKGKK